MTSAARPGQLPPAGASAELITRRVRHRRIAGEADLWLLPDGLLVSMPATPGVPGPRHVVAGDRADITDFDLDRAVLDGGAVWLPWSWMWFARLSTGPFRAALLVRTAEAERHRLTWRRRDPATAVVAGVLPGRLGSRFVRG